MFDPNIIWQSKQLPTLPAVAVKLLELTRDPETEIHQIVELIKTDPAISAKIIHSANSSYFGLSSRITTVDRAIPLLGTTVVTSLALSFSLASDSIQSGPMTEFYQEYWKQSVIHAVACSQFGKRCGRGLECEFFLAGLLMDVGRLAMLKSASRDYYPVLVTSRSRLQPLHEAEHEFLGLTHAEVSHRLMEDWMLPESLLNGVLMHHNSTGELINSLDRSNQLLEASMAIANAIGDYYISGARGAALKRFRELTAHFFDFSTEEADQFLETLREKIEQAGELFSVDMTTIGDPGDLMAEANQQLLQLTMRAHAESTYAAERQKIIESEKEELENQNQELQQKVTRDPLTKVFNRTYFDERLEEAVQQACERCNAVGVIFVDADKFKSLNDQYGHQFGDEVLRRISKALETNVRSLDLVARYGGEEFVILVSRPSEKGIAKLAERLRSTIENEDIQFEGQRIPVTASFGASIIIPGRSEQEIGDEIVKEADEAMYESKQNGRNRVTLRSLIKDDERTILKEIGHAKFSRWLVEKEVIDIPTISRALLSVPVSEKRFGEFALEMKMLNTTQIQSLLDRQEATQLRIGELAQQMDYLTRTQVCRLLARMMEPPEKLARSLIDLGYFSPERVHQLLELYLQEVSVHVGSKIASPVS